MLSRGRGGEPNWVRAIGEEGARSGPPMECDSRIRSESSDDEEHEHDHDGRISGVG